MNDHATRRRRRRYDAAPLLTKNYGSCANASRLRLDPPSKRRRSSRSAAATSALAYGFGLAFLVGGVLDVIFRIGPYRGKPKWRRRGYRRRRIHRRPHRV